MNAQVPSEENFGEEDEVIQRMTAAMRKADEIFVRVGGSTGHHVRDCLLPLLPKYGLELRLKGKAHPL